MTGRASIRTAADAAATVRHAPHVWYDEDHMGRLRNIPALYLTIGGLALACAALGGAARFAARGDGRTGDAAATGKTVPASVTYTDVAQAAGIRFRHDDCRNGPATMLEQIGPGCGLLDYDGDGWLDLYFVNGRDRYNRGLKRRNALYRNNRDGTFSDVTARAGVPGTGYGFGVAAGDYDNDGHTDLYVCQYGRNVLYRNNGDGTFADVTERAKVGALDAGEPFHVGAAWLDYDRDGRLDLFVTRYVDYEGGPRYCKEKVTPQGRRFPHGCPPDVYDPTRCALYRNNGDGTFTDVPRQAKIRLPQGKSLGLSVGDYNDDGWPDIFVANDATPSYLLRNRGDGTFREEGLAAGVALRESGGSMAGMGVDWGDYKNNGRLSLFVTDYQDQTNQLFENGGDGTFANVSLATGLDPATRPFLGFGGGFVDFDNDGWLDIFVANGHVVPEIGQSEQGEGAVRYKQTAQLFRNVDRGNRFAEVTADAGPAFRAFRVGRGAAWGDLWNRGVQDILVAPNTDAPLLMKHSGPPPGRHFLSLRLVGTRSTRDAIGARVYVTAGGLRQMREVKTSISFLSCGDPRLHFGLSGVPRADKVEVRWPLGRRDTFTNVAADRFYELVEGETTLGDQAIQGRGLDTRDLGAMVAPAPRP